MTCNLLNRKSFTVKRYQGEAFDKTTGLTRKRSFESFTIKGSAQPLSGHEILQVPEGDREKNHQNIFTRSELKTDDVVSIKGRDYEVWKVECWDDLPKLAHYMVTVRLIDVERD